MTRERPKEPDPVEDVKLRKGLEEHEGVPHKPEEFDPMNPARRDLSDNADQSKIISDRDADDVEREPRLRKDTAVSPGGNKPDTAMCEKKGEPGMVNKNEDC